MSHLLDTLRKMLMVNVEHVKTACADYVVSSKDGGYSLQSSSWGFYVKEHGMYISYMYFCKMDNT